MSVFDALVKNNTMADSYTVSPVAVGVALSPHRHALYAWVPPSPNLATSETCALPKGVMLLTYLLTETSDSAHTVFGLVRAAPPHAGHMSAAVPSGRDD